MRFPWASAAILLAACSGGGLTAAAVTPGPTDSGDDTAAPQRDAGHADATAPAKPGNLRIMTGNISSGHDSTYDYAETHDLIEGLHADVALLQEMKTGDGSQAAFQAFVQSEYGDGFTGYMEDGFEKPNAIVSRFPIVDSGSWTDDLVHDRSFAWAKIAAPNDHVLWAVSVHLLTSAAGNRAAEAQSVVGHLQAVAGPDDFMVVGGDWNVDARSEGAVVAFGAILKTTAPWPADRSGNDRTSANRNHPYDWVAVDPKLAALQVPTVLGTSTYANGIVFDSRVYTPLSDVDPIAKDDSAFTNMQHMPVVKDFAL